MRLTHIYILALTLIIGFIGPGATAETSHYPCVTCIAPEAVYLDGGITSGISLGDTLAFVRHRETVALAIVTKVAEEAAAAEVTYQVRPVKVGDVACCLADVERLTAPMVTMAASVSAPAPRVMETSVATVPSEPKKPSRLKGSISIENFARMDMTDSDLNRTQPGIRTRLALTNVGGTDLELKLRHRTRLYHRSSALYAGQDTDDWKHQIYELGLFHEVEGARTEWAIGRVLSPYVRGVGYIDGGYLAYQIHKNFKLGLAGGTAPDRVSSEPDFDRRKFGLFASFETGDYSTQRLALTTALSTEYDKETVSRDFLYLQATFSRKGLLSLYQSVEVDLNRDWRYDRAGERLTFTNYYANATVNITEQASLFASYDARKNIRYFELIDTPDSLFNDDVHQGIKAGLNWRFADRFYFRGHAGIRFREGLPDDNRFVSGLLRINQFPMHRHSVTLSMHIVETQFTTGYRPMIRYRFPLMRKLTLNLTGSSYIYKVGNNETSYYYADLNANYRFGRRYYLSGNIRQYFDSELESVEIRTELGFRL